MRLRAGGISVRQTAKEVFGDERFRCRVERIEHPRRRPVRTIASLDELDDLGLPPELVAGLRSLAQGAQVLVLPGPR